MPSTPTPPAGVDPRPVITDEMLLASGVPEADLDYMRENIEEMLDLCAARGRLSFSFGPDQNGAITAFDHAAQRPTRVDAIGEVEVATYTLLDTWTLSHPSPELVRNNPLGGIRFVPVLGGNDEVLAALASHADLDAIDLTAVVTEDHVANAQAEYQFEVEDLGSALASGGLTQAEHDAALLPPPMVRTGGERVTDAGLRACTGHEGLVSFAVTGSTITDAALAEVLPTMPKLTWVRIESEEVTGSFIAALADTDVEAIVLGGPKVTGATLSELPVMSKVTSLQVRTDGVFEGLDCARLRASFPNLEALTVGTPTTDEAPDERLIPLMAHFPGVEVNGLALTAKAIAKWAAKRGIELQEVSNV